jgi:hypothetical protein
MGPAGPSSVISGTAGPSQDRDLSRLLLCEDVSKYQRQSRICGKSHFGGDPALAKTGVENGWPAGPPNPLPRHMACMALTNISSTSRNPGFILSGRTAAIKNTSLNAPCRRHRIVCDADFSLAKTLALTPFDPRSIASSARAWPLPSPTARPLPAERRSRRSL